MADIPVTKLGLIAKFGKEVGSFMWKHFKEGIGAGEIHPANAAKQAEKLLRKQRGLAEKAAHAKGPSKISVLPRFTSPKKEATEHILDPKTGKKVVKKEFKDPAAGAKAKKARTAAMEKKGRELASDRKTARSPAKSRGMLQFGKSEKEKASQRLTSPSKKGIAKQTAIKKKRLQKSIYEVRDIDKRYPKATVYDFNPKTGKLEMTRGKVKPPKGHKGDPKDPQKPLMSKTRFAKRADRPGYGSRTKGQERPATVPQPVKGTTKKTQPKHEYVIDKKTGKKVLKYTKGTKPSQNPKWMTGKSRTTTTKAERAEAKAKAKAKAAKAKKNKEKKRSGFN
jgi:hypothetical protein